VSILRWVLRLVVVAALAVDAYVHLHLASTYDPVRGSGRLGLSQGLLFRVEAAAAIAAAVLVLLVRSRTAALLAAAVLLGGLAAVLLYRYVDVGPIGPLPSMYEPSWYPQKTNSALAEAVGGVAALLLALLPPRPPRRSPTRNR
jgi:hypothetical protein